MSSLESRSGSDVVSRTDGYLPLRDYALIGDGRTTALVGRDGGIDWLCLPDVDSAPVFDRLLDAGGGRFELRPQGAFTATRRYRDGTNVLETTFHTASGSVRVTDAMTLSDDTALAPLRELVRVVEGLGGTVPMRWRYVPRFDFGRRRMHFGCRGDALVATSRHHAVALRSWDAGDGEFELDAGGRATFVVSAAYAEPLVLPRREDAERRVEAAAAFWREWSDRLEYEGPWREQVVRSALTLKLLAFAPSGAIVAAPTTSLPERVGGDRNWDYRFGWLRDGVFTLRALLALGCVEEARAYFWWQMHATRTTDPVLRPLYCVDGGLREDEEELALPGYRGSAPVRIGNAAAAQLQLDVYGPVFEEAWSFHRATGSLGAATGRELAGLASFVAREWRRPDAGIWESRDGPADYVLSKAMCWTALDRALKLADADALPLREEWRPNAERLREWVETSGWDDARGAYFCVPGDDRVDASLLLLALCAYSEPTDPRFLGTLERVRAELGHGPFVYRFSGAEELEGAFVACSFWLVDALARAGRSDDAAALMDELVAAANDVGLYAEEIDPDTGEFLGNLPQGLVHLALVNAAVSLAGADS